MVFIPILNIGVLLRNSQACLSGYLRVEKACIYAAYGCKNRPGGIITLGSSKTLFYRFT